jgi:putative flippase GtrA
MQRFINLSVKLFSNQSIRFLAAGTFNTLYCYLIFILSMMLGLESSLAMTIATICSMCVGFFLMARFVFRVTPTLGRSKAFIVMQGIGYLININILSLASLTGISDYLAGFISLLITAVFTFFISKNVVFFKSTVVAK